MSENQLCWECSKACGYCPWSSEFKPISGWVATKKPDDSYEIKDCPLFTPDEKRRISVKDLGTMLGKSPNTIALWSSAKLKDAVKAVGYKLYIETLIFPHSKRKRIRQYYIRKIDK